MTFPLYIPKTSGPGQYLCPPNVYAPASPTILAVSSTTFAALSSGVICTGPFAAPASGSVKVTVSGIVNQQTATAAVAFALAALGTVTPLIGNSVQMQMPNITTYGYETMEFVVTGLTPGTSYNFDVLAATSNAADAAEMVAQSLTATTISAGRGAPITVTVQGI